MHNELQHNPYLEAHGLNYFPKGHQDLLQALS